MAYLELHELRRAFGPVVALDGIQIELAAGEFLSLLGPSGCGKTTALRLVAGFDRPDSGSIVIDGKDITRLSPNRRESLQSFRENVFHFRLVRALHLPHDIEGPRVESE